MPEHYSEAYLSQLIRDQVQENLHLDYKKTDSLNNTEKNRKEISKDVSAFANSDGGIIIYGIVEQKHLPEKIEGRKLEEGKREWLEQVINSRIEPRIWGVKIVQIDLQNEDDHAVFVVEIPQSHTAHQAFDRKYYRRFNFQSVAMHDYEVKQTMNRAREPILQLTIEEQRRLILPIPNNQYILPLLLKNLGTRTAKSIEVYIYLPRMLSYAYQGDWGEISDPGDNHNEYICFVFRADSARNFSPLHPRKQAYISHEKQEHCIALKPNNFPSYNSPLEGKFEIFAENMTPKYGKILINLMQGILSIQCV